MTLYVAARADGHEGLPVSEAACAQATRETPHVTVTVPVKDRRDRMLRCLDSLLAIDYTSYDILVLDNGSSDGTAEACRERAASASVPVRVEVVDGSVGHVRNAGARIARGEIIAYTDSDCMVAPEWLQAGVRPFADDRVGVVTGPTLPETPGPYAPWPATIEVTEQTWRFEASNALFRRDALVSNDGFLETVTMWEDAAAGWSVVLAGWKAAYEPGAIVRHDVTYPGLGWQLARGRRYGHVAALVQRYPEVRDHLLWHRYFLRPGNARVAAAAAAVALSPLNRRALLAALPYAWKRLPRPPTPGATRRSVEGILLDLAILLGMIEGSLRWRTLVL